MLFSSTIDRCFSPRRPVDFVHFFEPNRFQVTRLNVIIHISKMFHDVSMYYILLYIIKTMVPTQTIILILVFFFIISFFHVPFRRCYFQ